MRAPVIGMFWCGMNSEVIKAATLSARITHAHPLGVEGAVLIASAASKALACKDATQIFCNAAEACKEAPFLDRLDQAGRWLNNEEQPTPSVVRARMGNGMAAAESCVTALYLGLSFLDRPFQELLGFVAACGGDVDTIGAMAGSIWGAVNGVEALPSEPLQHLEQRARLETVAQELFAHRHSD